MRHQKLFEKKGHSSWVGCLKFSRDGRYIASGGGDNNIVLWDAKNGTELCVLSGHDRGIYSLDFDSNSQKILSCGYDESIKLWDINSKKLKKSISNLSGYWIFTNKNWSFYTINEKIFKFLDDLVKLNYFSMGLSNIGEFEINLVVNRSHQSFISHCNFDAECKYIFSADGVGELFVRDAVSFDVIYKHCIKSKSIRRLIYDTKENIIIVAGDNFIQVLDGDKFNVIKKIYKIKEFIRAIDFVKTKKILITGDTDRKIKIWNFINFKKSMEIGNHNHCVIFVKYISKYNVIISPAKDAVKIWNIDDYVCCGLFDKDLSNVSSACLSNDEKYLVFGHYDGFITCYELF